MDADCIPHKEFVAEHVKNRQSNTILTGRRANISEDVTLKLTPERVKRGDLENMKLTFLYEGLLEKPGTWKKHFMSNLHS